MNETSQDPHDLKMNEQGQPKFKVPFRSAREKSLRSVSHPPSKKRITDVVRQEQVQLNLDKNPQVQPVDALSNQAQKNSGQTAKQIEEDSKVLIYREFIECSSIYDLPLKEDSDISGNAEFAEAKNIQTYDQDATEVLVIENGIQGDPKALAFAKKAKANGVKSKRDKDFKYFTQVGYTGDDNRLIPRWAIDQNKMKKVLEYQRGVLKPEVIFGKWGPKVVADHFKPDLIFSKGPNQDGYKEMQDSIELLARVRGSSQKWNDHSEFGTMWP